MPLFSNFFKLIIAEGTAGGFNEPGIYGNALIDCQALVFKLVQDFRVELVHGLFGQSGSKARECGMIRRGFVKRQLQELFKGQAAIDLVFQRRVGVDTEPLKDNCTAAKYSTGRLCKGLIV